MKKYLVGGAVRDQLLGIKSRDHDYVVIDATADDLLRRGFLKVGNSYDVFLHPETKEEYVRAYDLTSDLLRRDLTINAMALDESGRLIDPFGGKADLDARVLRHTSEHFSDDPLRIYRLARFMAQLPDFKIADETKVLVKGLAQKSAFKKLHGNRVFNEIKTALETSDPAIFFNTLLELEALSIHFAHVKKWDHLKDYPADALMRFCALAMHMPLEHLDSFCDQLFVPVIWKLKARAANLAFLLLSRSLNASEIVEFFYAIDAFRRSELINFLSDFFKEKFEYLKKSFEVIKNVGVDDESLTGRQIAMEIKRKRIEILRGACIF